MGTGLAFLCNLKVTSSANKLDTLYTDFTGGFEKEEDKVLVSEKEKRKLVLLRQVEETWRQRVG
jgi:hypothetical protein